ncbi:hypothetical protein RB598_002877 [Gaeumannomyces tritici]
MSTSPKTVVILGASMAGLPLAHNILKNTAPKVPGGLKVILVSPNTHLYWCLASVRGVLPGADGGFGDDKLFYEIAPGFAKYTPEQFEFVLGSATALDPAAKTVTVQPSSGGGSEEGAAAEPKTLSYDYVVVATGSSARDGMPWKTAGDTAATRALLEQWRAKVAAAKSIVVAGAGLTGIEVAGELGDAYASKGTKDVTIVVDDDLPLPDKFSRPVRAAALAELERLKVKVLVSRRVTSAKEAEDGTGVVTLEIANKAGGGGGGGGDPETLTTDLYMPTFGVVFNTAFVPADLLDAAGRVRTTSRLRAEGHDDVYALGDAASLQPPNAMHIEPQVAYVAKDLAARLLAPDAAAAAAPPPPAAEFKPSETIMFMASIGKGRGVGQVGSFKLPSFATWLVKSRTLLTQRGPATVAA